jgi:Fe-S cluster assembly protein SufD
MPLIAAEQGFTQASFEAFLAARREPPWLADARRQAWETFCRLELPDVSQEEWRRTDIRAFRLERFGLARPAEDVAAPPQAMLSEGVDLAGRLVAVDSGCTAARLDPELARRGVLFGPLDQLLAEHGELLRPHFERRVVEPGYDKFAALSAACWSGGALLYVPRGVAVERPLHVLSLLSPGGVDLGRILVVLDEGAEATLLTETQSLDAAAPGFHCGAAELLVGPRARLRYVSLQNWGSGVWHFAHQKALVGRDAALQWTLGALGARLAKVNQHVALVEPGAEAQVNGAMFTEGRQHLSYHTHQHHQAPHCRSDLLYKGALQDKSRIVWRGMIRVDPGADKTDGYQRDDNLLLSEDARCDSIPGLEILADDVKCSHGATAGRVDDEPIFYALTRGLTPKEAIRMIVTGFFQQVFDRITIESVRRALAEAIGRRVREFR